MSKLIDKIIPLLFVFFLVSPTIACAAEIFFECESSKLVANQEFSVNVFLNTEKELVNAVGGKIHFPANLLDVKDIRDGNTAINFWIEKPIEKQGVISFSGITPGGFRGQKKFIFSIIFFPKKESDGKINFSEIQLLSNDDKSTPIETQIQDFEFTINQSGVKSDQTLEQVDKNPPETFNISVESDPNLFDGKYFLVFATQDKGTGIDHYEVREGFLDKYVIAESPYLLKNQSLNKKIYVKAIDKAHNERIATFESKYLKKLYFYYLLSGIIVIFSIFLFSKKLWPKNTN